MKKLIEFYQKYLVVRFLVWALLGGLTGYTIGVTLIKLIPFREQVYVYSFLFTNLIALISTVYYFGGMRRKTGWQIAVGVIASVQLLAFAGMTTLQTKNGYIFPYFVPWGDYFSLTINMFMVRVWITELLCAAALVDLSAKALLRTGLTKNWKNK